MPKNRKPKEDSKAVVFAKLLLSAIALSGLIYYEYEDGWWTPNPSDISEWIDNFVLVVELTIDLLLIGLCLYFAISTITQKNETN